MAGVVDENLLLIKEIKAKPALWNQYSPNYHHREVTDQIWDQLSQKYSVSVDHLKTKWIALRSQFRRLYLRQIQFHKTNPGKKVTHSWKYFIPLLFLRNQIKKSKLKSLTEPNSDFDEEIIGEMMKEFDAIEADYEEPQTSEPHFSQQYATQISNIIDNNSSNSTSNVVLNNLLESFQKDMIALENEKITNIDESKTDEDVLFLHSLLPFMKSLSLKKKLILRTKIQSLVCNYIMNLDENYFNAVAANSMEKRTADVTVNEENQNDIQINVYDKLDDIPQQEVVTSIAEENQMSESIIAKAGEVSDSVPSNETNECDVSLDEDSIALGDGISLRRFKDDSYLWLYVDE